MKVVRKKKKNKKIKKENINLVQQMNIKIKVFLSKNKKA